MYTSTVESIIKEYKTRFDEINAKEIYKWKAVEHFQKHWNIESENFEEMLTEATSLTKNLLDSRFYYPREMLLWFAQKEPQNLKSLFSQLYDEKEDLTERIKVFSAETQKICKRHFPRKLDYQDIRAVAVYLALRFPDKHYLFKNKMFKDFTEIIQDPYKVKRVQQENVVPYISLCKKVREHVLADRQLLEMNSQRIGPDCYIDGNYNLLVQDIIYAATVHLNPDRKKKAVKRPKLKQRPTSLTPKKFAVRLRGKKVDHLANALRNSRTGLLGELLVLAYEQEKQKRWKSNKEVEHTSKTRGDGLGYDILSYNKKGDPVFIEVKTTTGRPENPFFITANELEASKQEGNSYRLYRLYNYDEEKNSALFFEITGSLEKWCINPVLYKAGADANVSDGSEMVLSL